MKQCGTVTAEDLVTQVYERLQQLIVHGRLAPGSRIIESDLAARIGVSRTPVRSAMHRLQQEGLVVASDSGKNARLSVAPLTRADGRELLHILGCLEGMAAGWACALDPDSRRSLARDMEELDEKMRRLLEEAHPDPEHIFQLHSTFHRLPLERIDAPRLHALHSAVRPQVERYRQFSTDQRIYRRAAGARPHHRGAAAGGRGRRIAGGAGELVQRGGAPGRDHRGGR